MASPYVQTVGTLDDFYGRHVTVGADHDAITIGEYVFDPDMLALLMDLIVKAARQAAVNGAERKLYADGWGRPCSTPTAHALTECNGYHLDESDT